MVNALNALGIPNCQIEKFIWECSVLPQAFDKIMTKLHDSQILKVLIQINLIDNGSEKVEILLSKGRRMWMSP